MISDYLFRTDIIVTSILHDTIEDTDLTFEMVKAIFNEIIANQVMDLTRIKENGRKISAAEMLESLWFQQKYDALLIKLFDRLHNMQTIGAKSPEKIRKVIEETFELFLVLSVYFQTHKIEKELIQLCCNYLDIKPGARSISFSDEFFSG
jgi:(p)ppGpp synthase/HD superfamily hydrolase